MITKSDLQKVLEQMSEEDRKTRLEPPTVEELLAYRRGELSGNDEARVRELLICWPELLRALMTPYPDDDGESLPPEVLERQWNAMRRRVGIASGGRGLSIRNASTAIAAALAIVFFGLWWQAKLESRQPRAGSYMTLMPDRMRGPGKPVNVLNTNGNAYLLASSGERGFKTYKFELVDAANPPRRVWTSDPITATEDTDSLSLFIPRASFEPGTYTLILYGVNGSREEQLETYAVRVSSR